MILCCYFSFHAHVYVPLRVREASNQHHLSSIAFHLSFWDRISHWTWTSRIPQDWLVHELRRSSCFVSPALRLEACSTTLGFFCGCWDLNLNPHVCLAGVLPHGAVSLVLWWHFKVPYLDKPHQYFKTKLARFKVEFQLYLRKVGFDSEYLLKLNDKLER